MKTKNSGNENEKNQLQIYESQEDHTDLVNIDLRKSDEISNENNEKDEFEFEKHSYIS